MSQALRELDKLKEAVAAKQAVNTDDVTDVEAVRWIAFTLTKAARATDASGRPLSLKFMSEAKALHFKVYGAPEIDMKRFGPKHHTPIVCIDGGKPNQLTPLDADDTSRWGY